MSDYLFHILVLLNRYLHVVCTAMLVGGTLFYEMVVPVAIGELKTEQQLIVFARARWLFRWIVWASAIVLIVTGVVSSYRNLGYYLRADAQQFVRVPYAPPSMEQEQELPRSALLKPGWWWAAHASTGILTILIALGLTIPKQPPVHPIQWMRINLVLLLVVIFIASATRHVRRLNEHSAQGSYNGSFAPD
jgi:hypothetical protein